MTTKCGEKTMNKLFLLSLILVGVLVIGSYIYFQQQEETKSIEFTTENYKSLIVLGLAPSTQSREPTQFDYDTGVRLTDGENNYALYHSRTFMNKDLGGTFLVRI